MFLKKTPKAKGTYLAITESYYDKEKKATRQKTIMGLGYLEDLKKDYPDPISHFEKVVAVFGRAAPPGLPSTRRRGRRCPPPAAEPLRPGRPGWKWGW